MTVQLLQQGPPPYIRFENRAEEDRTATIEKGSLVLKDVDYVIIARAGSKDTVEKVVTEWLDHCAKLSRETPPLWPVDWVVAHRKMYEQWKAGEEPTQPGFPVRQWAEITKAQAENLVMARVFTVEHLAMADEATMQNIGMGGRALKERAQAWLESKKGNSGQEVAALRADNATLTQTVGSLQQKVAELEAALAAQPGRKRA